MVTLLDVARKAKVSVATVSRVINGKPFVKQEVRDRVNKACEELGYMKDLNAERLRRGVHSDIGIIASYPDWPIVPSVYNGLYRASAIAGASIVLTCSFSDPVKERECFASLLASKVKAIIFSPSTAENAEAVALCHRNGVKAIQAMRKAYDDVPAVCFDIDAAIDMACSLLKQSGVRRPLFVDPSLKFLSCSNACSRFYLNMGEEGALCIDEGKVSNEPESIGKAIELYSPDGIVCGSDASCAAAYKYLMSANRKVPLIGFGNDEWKKTLGITAVDFESEEFALALLAALQEEEPTDKKVAPLLHRRSFGF